ncbi:helix-turn-helix domain-containing protein [Neobacillus massiliamazoniensis]|uniref:Transcriptional regulator/TPR domain protein n=1 Tax=Neobacillus massiliamazoniensis TaxID=1499688 RepID=A0A0U1NV31_9BACI|nr:helix-turn-helix transcriptional regulator [Neobacillus massiliamazoniensis]CRK81835.1 transcriptional regulator/TPR domain protein [Neobacillus massiliamazoniensis]
MYEGKIIKFYREKYKLTQEQLGKDICSVTHISKIECAQTTYAHDIITLLSKRLGINMESEVEKLKNIKQRLFNWNEAIIMQLFDEMDQINNELEHEELIQISEYNNMYQLLRARYLLMQNNFDEAFKLIKKIQKTENKLTPYDTNLLKHILGIYYISTHDYVTAIQILKEIQNEFYHNPEYYYYLAMAYHTLELPVLAYYYAEKSHQFFENMNNYLRVIDAEMIMIIQIKDGNDYDDIINRFKKLIKSCEICNAPDRKAKVLHNLAYEYLRRKNYEQASLYYKESMSLKENESPYYLLSLEGYIRSSFEGGLIPNEELIQYAQKGLTIAINTNQLLYIHLFKLFLYLLKSKEKEYHQYLSNKALPMFIKCGYTYLIQRSKKELFNYYYKMKLTDEALEMAQLLINPEKLLPQ